LAVVVFSARKVLVANDGLEADLQPGTAAASGRSPARCYDGYTLATGTAARRAYELNVRGACLSTSLGAAGRAGAAVASAAIAAVASATVAAIAAVASATVAAIAAVASATVAAVASATVAAVASATVAAMASATVAAMASATVASDAVPASSRCPTTVTARRNAVTTSWSGATSDRFTIATAWWRRFSRYAIGRIARLGRAPAVTLRER
jgi:hypothetical protein